MGKHLKPQDRVILQETLDAGDSFADAAKKIGCHRSTISREVKSRRIIPANRTVGNTCIYRNKCELEPLCFESCKKKYHACNTHCGQCNVGCPNYKEDLCQRLFKAPFVCNNCTDMRKCWLQHYIYDAVSAQNQYESILSESRSGISLTESELEHIDSIISPLILKGQSVNVVFENHQAELPITARTAYKYIDSGLLVAKNLDLSRKVRRRNRLKAGPTLKVDKACYIGRTYDDYEAYMKSHPELNTVEGDSVEGKKGGKVLLTLTFRNCGVQLMYLRDSNNSASVTNVFLDLKSVLGYALFHDLFQVLLFDRGSEFTDPCQIESVVYDTDETLSPVFYCDPMNSNQKARCERNHEFIRYIIPKGRSMDHLTQEKTTLMMNHINSYPRKKWNGKSPLDMFIQIYGQETATLLGLKRIEPDSIILKPELLK